MIFRPAAWIAIVAVCTGVAQNPEAPEVRAHESAPPFRIRVETNLVTVRVVVRDTNGRPVATLQKQDFRLFDNGTPQEITGFRLESTAPKTAAVEAPASAPGQAVTSAPAAALPEPQRFVALFFDDFHMPIEDIARTRNAAWRYLSTSVRSEDRVAIFTSSGKEQLDFTNDRDKLHDSLFRVGPSSRTIPLINRCPEIGEYQAYLIDHLQDTRALDIATAEGYECNCKSSGDTSSQCRETQLRMARFDAAQIWNLADQQSQRALEAIEVVIRRLAAMPGQRVMALVSPGFLTSTRNNDVDALVNRALRQSVVINAIDAAGLYTRVSHSPLAGMRLDLDVQKTGIENEKLKVQRDVLAGLSAGTGGLYFQNNNDFDLGFRIAAQAPEAYYVLSFSPQKVKLDGTLHALKVVLNNQPHLSVEARRGYVASKPEAESAAPTQTDLEKLIFSLDELHGLPVEVTARAEPGAPTSTLSVRIHVDLSVLHFRKQADRNIDTLIFETALFDQDGKYITAKQASLDLNLKDANFQKFVTSGINAVTKFQVPPGSYRVREVVHDSESKELSALNCNVQTPH